MRVMIDPSVQNLSSQLPSLLGAGLPHGCAAVQQLNMFGNNLALFAMYLILPVSCCYYAGRSSLFRLGPFATIARM